MVLDISIGSIFAAVIPADLRSRVSGAFQAVNYGTRPVGALLGGLLGTLIGLRPALWIASAGGVLGFLALLPSPLPRFRMPSADDEQPPRLRQPNAAAGAAARTEPGPHRARETGWRRSFPWAAEPASSAAVPLEAGLRSGRTG